MNPRLTVILMIVLIAALMRIVPHPANVTPIAAMALFAGAYLPDRRLALVIPLAAMLLSDLVIGLHASMLYVYAGVAVTVLIGGAMLKRNPSVMPAIAASLVSSVMFFLITNYGTWVTGVLYPRTAEGLMMAYTAGIPFFRNSVLGDLFFTAMLFGGFQVLERSLPALRAKTAR
jgi:hypothetical protein